MYMSAGPSSDELNNKMKNLSHVELGDPNCHQAILARYSLVLIVSAFLVKVMKMPRNAFRFFRSLLGATLLSPRY